MEDSPGGPVVKYPPANAGDTGFIPVPGRSHVPQGSYARGPQLSPHSRARAPQPLKAVRLEPVLYVHQEGPPQREARTQQGGEASARPSQEENLWSS